MNDVKVDQQSHLLITQFEIRQQLGLVNLKQLFDNFQFNDHLAVDEQIDLVATFDFNAVV